MIKKTIILILIFYFLTLFQVSTLPHFFWQTPNLILILIVLINLFESPKSYLGIFLAFFGGFFLDIFSENFIGYYFLISLGLSIFIKFFLKQYVQIPVFKKT